MMMKAGSVGRRETGYDDYNEYGLVEEENVDDIAWDECGRNMISHIYVWFDKIIRCIQFGYLENGVLVLSKKHGYSETPYEPVGLNFRVVRLNQDEYITGLSGVAVPGGGGIKELTFNTNRGNYGPFGHGDGLNARGTKIEIDPAIRDQREFGGFFGSYSSRCLTSIGIYVCPITSSEKVAKREEHESKKQPVTKRSNLY